MSDAASDPRSLERLHDLVVPEAVAWWPPEPAWWLVAALLLVALGLGTAGWLRLHRATRYRRAALGEVAAMRAALEDPASRGAAVRALPALLKRTAIHSCGRTRVAALHGEAWWQLLGRYGRKGVPVPLRPAPRVLGLRGPAGRGRDPGVVGCLGALDPRPRSGPVIELAHPWVLLLAPLPLLVRALAPPHREPREAVYAPFAETLAELTGQDLAPGAVQIRRTWFQGALFVLAWLAVLLALARPQYIGEPIVRELPTRDLLLAVDLSGSMETADFTDAEGETIDRLSAVKEVLGDFLVRRDGDRVGLLFFGSAAFVQAPFTDDLEVCRRLLDEAAVRMAGPRTVVGDAIGLAIHTFDESELDERVLILLTDGNDTGSRVPPDRAAEIARDQGIVIHTVAVGDPRSVGEGALDEEILKRVASTTGGLYAHAGDREELAAVYARIDELEQRVVETQSHRPRTELFTIPLAAMLVVTLAFHAIAGGFAWRRRFRLRGADA